MKILVAEDDRTSLMVLEAHLLAMGHEVATTTDGRQAWAALEQGRFPVLISDCMMPELDGLELTRRIRAERRAPYTYIILLTAHGGREEYLHGMDAGADDFLSKPYDAEQLETRLRVAQRVLSLERELQSLSGLLPMCSYCRRIRDDGEAWVDLESYVTRHSEADFSHGVCPDCVRSRVRPEIERLKSSRDGRQ